MTDLKNWQCDIHDSDEVPVTGCEGCTYAVAYRRGWNEGVEAASEVTDESCRCQGTHENDCLIFDAINAIKAIKLPEEK